MFDPCGTRRMDGDDILFLLAKSLNATPAEVYTVLTVMIEAMRESNRHE